jgi:UDP-2,3-diacylglucosamine pyrophosphatase LpxH
MAKKERVRVIAWSLVALASGLGMNAYFYSLQGAKGLYLWNQTGLFRTLLVSALIPLSVALLTFPLEKLGTKIPAKVGRGISLALSFLVVLGSLGLTGFFIAKPRMGELMQVRLNLVDPAQPLVSISGPGSEAAMTDSSSQAEKAPQPGSEPDAMPRLRLSFSSDPHWGVESANPQARKDILASVAEHKPDLFFMLGDTVETGSNAAEWNQALMDLSAIIPKVPLRPLMGNHDALFGGQYLYKKAFFPAGFSSDSKSPYYYSLRGDAATVLVLNLPWGTEELKGAQEKWIKATLETADKSKPIIVLSHSFFYASGYDDPELDKPWYDHYQNIPALSPLFEKYGVDLVISGHNHYQELLEHGGVTYVVVGSMGGKPDPAPAYVSPASKWIAVGTYGRLDVDIYPDALGLTFRDADGDPLHEKRIALVD